MKVVAIIADIVESRQITNRPVFQRRLVETLEAINSRSRLNLHSPYTVTLGDEFQAVYKGIRGVFDDIVTILWRLEPYKARFAVNVDHLTTDINSENAFGMDGPAFHGARSTLAETKKEKDFFLSVKLGSKSLRLVDAALSVASNVISDWSKTTIGALSLTLENADMARMTRELGVKERAVYKAISANHVRDYCELFHAVEAIIELESNGEIL